MEICRVYAESRRRNGVVARLNRWFDAQTFFNLVLFDIKRTSKYKPSDRTRLQSGAGVRLLEPKVRPVVWRRLCAQTVVRNLRGVPSSQMSIQIQTSLRMTVGGR